MDIKTHDERFAKITEERDKELLARVFALAEKAREAGNTPFGALLADSEGNILMEQENIELTERDSTGHAETTLARRAAKAYDKQFLWTTTLYSSAEPCCMCTGAIYWSNIGRIVYGLAETDLLQATGDNEVNPTFNISSREILSRGQKDIVVKGPFPELKEDALVAHKGY